MSKYEILGISVLVCAVALLFAISVYRSELVSEENCPHSDQTIRQYEDADTGKPYFCIGETHLQLIPVYNPSLKMTTLQTIPIWKHSDCSQRRETLHCKPY